MKNSDVLSALDRIEAGDLTIAAYREELAAKPHKGRSPLFEYEHLQKRINEVAPKVKLKDGSYAGREHSFATLVYESFLREGAEKIQKPAQLRNLFKLGKLVLPADPVVEAPVTEVVA